MGDISSPVTPPGTGDGAISLAFFFTKIMNRERIVDTSWFDVGLRWGDDPSVIHNAMGLLAYQTNQIMRRDLKHCGGTTLLFKCIQSFCQGEIKFSFLTGSNSWRVSSNTAHSDECTRKSSDPDFIKNLWTGQKLETLVRAEFLAALVTPRLRQAHPNGELVPVPKEIGQILIDFHLVPPFYTDHPGAQQWFFRLTSRIKTLIENTKLTADRPSIEQLINVNNSTEGLELLFLETFAQKFRELDPDNKFIINTDEITNQYLSCYMVFGITKRMATSSVSTFQINVDGTHFKHPMRTLKCPGSFRAILYSDADGCIYPLILIHETKEESIATWKPCIQLLLSLFADPSKLSIGSDRDKGLDHVFDELEKQIPFSNVFCHFHLKQNVKSRYKGAEKLLAEQLFERLSSAPTVTYFEKLMQKTSVRLPTLAAYLKTIDPKYWAISHFPANRIDKTSNPAESYWSALLRMGIREMTNIVSVFLACHQYLITKLEREFLDKRDWTNSVSKIAVREITASNEASKTMTVININNSSGTVIEPFGDRFQCDFRLRTCNCTKNIQKQFFCPHLMALARSKNLNQAYTLFAPLNYWHISWVQAMDLSKPWTRLEFNYSHLQANNSFRLPLYGGMRGKPSNEPQKRKKKNLTKSKTGENVFKDANFKNGTSFDLNNEKLSQLSVSEVHEIFFQAAEKIGGSTSGETSQVIQSSTNISSVIQSSNISSEIPRVEDRSNSLFDDSQNLELAIFRSLQDNSELEAQRARIRARLTKHGMSERLVEVPGDGNCFFASIGLLIGKEQRQVRTDLVSWLRSNEHFMEEPLSLFTDVESWELYCHQMDQDKCWADNIVLMAAAELYRRELRIISSAPGDQYIILIRPRTTVASGSNPFFLVHWHERHYEPIVDKIPSVSEATAINHVDINDAELVQTSDIRILAEFKRPSSRSSFPLVATDINKQELKLTCKRCSHNISILWSSSKGFDLYAICDNCRVRYQKDGKAIYKQGMHEITFASESISTQPDASSIRSDASSYIDGVDGAVMANNDQLSVEDDMPLQTLQISEKSNVDPISENQELLKNLEIQNPEAHPVCGGTDFKPLQRKKRLHIDITLSRNDTSSKPKRSRTLNRSSRDRANKRLERKND